jgi:hypothetical protein
MMRGLKQRILKSVQNHGGSYELKQLLDNTLREALPDIFPKGGSLVADYDG